MALLRSGKTLEEGDCDHRKRASRGARSGDLGYHAFRGRFGREQGPHPTGCEPGDLLAGSRVPFCSSADKQPRMREGSDAASNLFQGPRRPCYRRDGARRGSRLDNSERAHPQLESRSDDLVRGFSLESVAGTKPRIDQRQKESPRSQTEHGAPSGPTTRE